MTYDVFVLRAHGTAKAVSEVLGFDVRDVRRDMHVDFLKSGGLDNLVRLAKIEAASNTTRVRQLFFAQGSSVVVIGC